MNNNKPEPVIDWSGLDNGDSGDRTTAAAQTESASAFVAPRLETNTRGFQIGPFLFGAAIPAVAAILMTFFKDLKMPEGFGWITAIVMLGGAFAFIVSGWLAGRTALQFAQAQKNAVDPTWPRRKWFAFGCIAGLLIGALLMMGPEEFVTSILGMFGL